MTAVCVLGLPTTAYGLRTLNKLKDDFKDVQWVQVDEATREGMKSALKEVSQKHANIAGVLGNNWRLNRMAPVDKDLFEPILETLRMVTSGGAGFDHVAVQSLTSSGVFYCNTPQAVLQSTATLATTLILACLRRIAEADHHIRSGEWKRIPAPFFSPETANEDTTVGILGLGRIGRCAAKQLRAFECQVIYHNRHRLSPELEEGAEYHETLHSMLKKVNVLLIALPLSDATKYIISKDELALMPKGAIVVNIARGGLLDENALADAIESGHLAGAGIDTLEDEMAQPTPKCNPRFVNNHKIIMTPHMGALTSRTIEKAEAELAFNMREFLENGQPSNAVNAPVMRRSAL